MPQKCVCVWVNTLRSSAKDNPCSTLQFNKGKTASRLFVRTCIHIQRHKHIAHTPRWMSEMLLTEAEMITAYGKPPQPHFLFHLLSPPSSLPHRSPCHTPLPSCYPVIILNNIHYPPQTVFYHYYLCFQYFFLSFFFLSSSLFPTLQPPSLPPVVPSFLLSTSRPFLISLSFRSSNHPTRRGNTNQSQLHTISSNSTSTSSLSSLPSLLRHPCCL